MIENTISMDQYPFMHTQDCTPITDKEKRSIQRRAWDWAKQHGWAINKRQFENFVSSHKEAREKGNERRMTYIEEVLTEINFHTACSYLHFGEYENALKDWRE